MIGKNFDQQMRAFVMKIRDWDANLKIRLSGEFLFNVVFWCFFPFLSIYFTQWFGKGWTGLALVFAQALSVFANLTGGYCADRFGRKRMMVLAATCQAIGYAIFAVAALPWLELPAVGYAGFCLASLSGALYWPASQAMVADVVEERHQSSVFAMFYTAVNVAVVFGPLIGSAFFLRAPYAVLAVASAFCFVFAIVLLKFVRETAPRLVSPDRSREPKPSEPWYRVVTNQLRDYRVIATDRVFLLFVISGVLLAQTFMQLDLLFPVFLKETVHSSSVFSWGDWNWKLTGDQMFGVIVSENGLLVALFTVVITKWAASLKDIYTFVGGALFYAAGIAMFGQMSAFWGFALAIVVFTVAELLSAGPQQAFVSRIAPEHMRAQYFAASSLRFTLGRTIAPLTIPVSQWIGYDWTFRLLTAISIVSAALYYFMFKRYNALQA
jgi:MFS transporter, DHA1 family, multidrug resistance protein B